MRDARNAGSCTVDISCFNDILNKPNSINDQKISKDLKEFKEGMEKLREIFKPHKVKVRNR